MGAGDHHLGLLATIACSGFPFWAFPRTFSLKAPERNGPILNPFLWNLISQFSFNLESERAGYSIKKLLCMCLFLSLQCLSACQEDIGDLSGKPVIYFCPKERTEFTIKLDFHGPLCGMGWDRNLLGCTSRPGKSGTAIFLLQNASGKAIVFGQGRGCWGVGLPF